MRTYAMKKKRAATAEMNKRIAASGAKLADELEETATIRAKEYLGCNVVSEEKMGKFVNLIRFIGDLKNSFNK